MAFYSLLDVQYSLIRFIRQVLPEVSEVVWMYDGITLSDKQKPFVTVESLNVTTSSMEKQRVYFAETFTFQVGVFANSHREALEITDELKQLLLHNDVSLIRASDGAEVGKMTVDVFSITHIPPSDVSDETGAHRFYLDARISIINYV